MEKPVNSLNLNLQEGQKVVMEGNGPEESRTVTVTGGFGMRAFTTGSALFVELPDGTPAKMNGMEIEMLVFTDGPERKTRSMGTVE